MCVAITLLADTTLGTEEIIQMQRANADGVGVAWARNGQVEWLKALSPDPSEISHLLRQTIRYPRLVHFRLATAGGGHVSLCHPFEVGPKAGSDQMGQGEKVMIHNGHWHRWNDVRDLLDRENLLPDRGPWSDSRLGALLAHMDPEWLDNLGGRTATLDAEGTIERRGDWQELRRGVWVSNKIWSHTSVKRGGYPGYQRWKGWEWDDTDWAEIEKERERVEREAELAAEKDAKAETDACQLVREELEDEAAKKAKTRGKKATPDSPEGHGGGGNGNKKGKNAGKEYKKTTARGKNERWVKNTKGQWVPVLYSDQPWFSERLGKWFCWDKSGEVVEITPPGEESPAGEVGEGGQGAGDFEESPTLDLERAELVRAGIDLIIEEEGGWVGGTDHAPDTGGDSGLLTHWSDVGGEG